MPSRHDLQDELGQTTVVPIGRARGGRAREIYELISGMELYCCSGVLAVLVVGRALYARTTAFHTHIRRALGDPALAAIVINSASDAVDLSKLPTYTPPPRETTHPEGEEWRETLQYRLADGEQVLRGNALNVSTILLNHPEWRGVIAYDLFGERVVTRRPPPWPEELRPTDAHIGAWRDLDDSLLSEWFQLREGSDMGRDALRAGLSVAAARLGYHPVREHLDSLVWDGVPRLDRMLPDYMRTPDTLYEARVGACWMRQAVARVYEPGCQADYALIFEGEQGVGKSSALQALVWDPALYADSGVDVTNKDSYENLRGKWIYCLSELASMTKGDVERWKNYITSRQDSYRRAYGDRSQDYPRQTVFCGDTNRQRYLSDASGARRWWPVAVGSAIDVARIARDRDQLWAEAVATYRSGAPRWLDTSGVELLAREQQSARQVDDPWTAIIASWLAAPTQSLASEETSVDAWGIPRLKVSEHTTPLDLSAGLLVGDVLAHALHLRPEQMRGEPSTRVAAILRQLGWTSERRMMDGVRAVRWFRPQEASAADT